MTASQTGSDEREALRDSVQGFLRKAQSPADLRRLIDDDAGFDPQVWHRACSELGLAAMALPLTCDGLGLGMAEVAMVMEEMGRSLVTLPYLSSAVLAGSVLTAAAAANDATATELLRSIAAGRRATLAAPMGETPVGAVAQQSGQHWTIDGETDLVLDGATSELLLVAARTPAGLTLFAVDGHAPGLTRTALPGLDLTRRVASLTFAQVPARSVGEIGGAGPALDICYDRALVALAAEQLGGARACLEMSVDYARTRFQFGRQIGSFQAIKHKCADMMVAVETAAAALASALEEDTPGPTSARASLAKTICSEAFDLCATHNIQIHGGIGFTWEHDAHLYFRRAKACRALFGDPALHRERYAQHQFADTDPALETLR